MQRVNFILLDYLLKFRIKNSYNIIEFDNGLARNIIFIRIPCFGITKKKTMLVQSFVKLHPVVRYNILNNNNNSTITANSFTNNKIIIISNIQHIHT